MKRPLQIDQLLDELEWLAKCVKASRERQERLKLLRQMRLALEEADQLVFLEEVEQLFLESERPAHNSSGPASTPLPSASGVAA
jgi:hypothetical protein